jgi:hypothetical protein
MSEEKFSKVHHEIVSEIGSVLSSLGANSGIMANIMSWGDTQDSEQTLQNLKDYRESFLEVNNQLQHQ